jgi:hypothetical protein
MGQIVGNSTSFGVDAVSGIAVGGGIGVFGQSDTEAGVSAASKSGNGVNATSASGDGVAGFSTSGSGVAGTSTSGSGVAGTSSSGSGVAGTSSSGFGVYGVSGTVSGTTPVAAYGVYGESNSNDGVHGATSSSHSGVSGTNTGTAGGYGVWGQSDSNDGVHGVTSSSSHSALSGTNTGGGNGVYGQSSGNAGWFEGNVNVTGNVNVAGDVLLAGGDCAERFDLKTLEDAEPGTVMVIDEDGALRQSDKAYDRKVAGVVSGAGTFKPGIVLDQRAGNERRTTIALVGKVYCKVDADAGPIAVGDLLTSSDTVGHAMRVSDPLKGFGSVIGKALRPLKSGRALLPILVALQ